MAEERKKIAIVIDYSIRIPNFRDCFAKCKAEIFSGESISADHNLTQRSKDQTGRDFWINLHKKGNEEYSFYETIPVPPENFGEGFDYTLKKYFYNDEHRLKFLDDWSYNLFGQGSVTNNSDINLINICQSKVCDVILIDRVTHSRKIPNTLSFLSKSSLFIKGIQFINKIEEIEELEKNPSFIGIYDPVKDNSLVLIPGRTKIGEPSSVLLDWFMKIENKLR